MVSSWLHILLQLQMLNAQQAKSNHMVHALNVQQANITKLQGTTHAQIVTMVRILMSKAQQHAPFVKLAKRLGYTEQLNALTAGLDFFCLLALLQLVLRV